MVTMLYAAGKWGGILTLIALAIVVLRQLVFLIGVISFAIKAGLVLAFLALFFGVAFMIFKSWKEHRKEQQM